MIKENFTKSYRKSLIDTLVSTYFQDIKENMFNTPYYYVVCDALSNCRKRTKTLVDTLYLREKSKVFFSVAIEAIVEKNNKLFKSCFKIN